jgi:hypothetical protein
MGSLQPALRACCDASPFSPCDGGSFGHNCQLLKIRFSKSFQHHGGFNFLVRGSTTMTHGLANPFSDGLIGLPLTLHNHDKKYRKELLPFHWYILMWRKRLTPDDGYACPTHTWFVGAPP